MANELAAGPRWLDVAPGRIAGWLDSFAARHGGLAGPPEPAPPQRIEHVTFRAADGTAAECHPPFPPLPPAAADPAQAAPAQAAPAQAAAAQAAAALAAAALAAHATAPRTVGVLLVRLG